MASYNERLQNPELEKIMNRFATYTGSSPYKTPAFMNQLAVVEMVLGGFYPNGGIFNIPKALERLCLDLGVEFEFNCKIEKINVLKSKIEIFSNTKRFSTKKLISNIDYYTTQHLLGIESRKSRTVLSTSAIVFYWGIKSEFKQLKLHNIIFSDDYKKEFSDIFKDLTIPKDPTIYINISSKIDSKHAPKGSENWFVMINVPSQKNLISDNQIKLIKDLIIKNVYNKFKVNIENLIEFEQILTPNKLFKKTGSYLGSLYGNHQNSIYSIMKRKQNQDQKIKDLYYVGGTVHPGGGMPLALRSGVNTANKILNEIS
jgi:phytoene desaturase